MYNICLCILFAVLSLLIALIVYPVCFAAELNLGKFSVFENFNIVVCDHKISITFLLIC